MKKKIIALILTLTVLVTLFAACGKEAAPDSTMNSSLPSAEAAAFFPPFETETLDGEGVTDEFLKGSKVTMVNVWGTFCAPCIREMPALQKLSKDYEAKDVRVIGIVCDTFDVYSGTNIPEKLQDAKDILKQTGVKYTNLLPSVSLKNAKLDGVFSVPTTYFLNEKGEIIGTEFVGSRTYEQWSAILDGILESL